MPRGGAREGAGRKKGDKYLVRFWVTADEEIALKGYLARMRAAHKSEADILADLEKTGQGKLFEITATKTKVNKPTIQSEGELENIALWEIKLCQDVNNALKTSKKAATAILAQEVCNTINNPLKNDYERFLSVLAGLMNLLRDKRKRKEAFADDNEMAEVFLLRNGYVKHFDYKWKKHLSLGYIRIKHSKHCYRKASAALGLSITIFLLEGLKSTSRINPVCRTINVPRNLRI